MLALMQLGTQKKPKANNSMHGDLEECYNMKLERLEACDLDVVGKAEAKI